MTLRDAPGAEDAIVRLLGGPDMAPNLQLQTRHEVRAFLSSGSATDASQLIHAASVRRTRSLAVTQKGKADGSGGSSR